MGTWKDLCSQAITDEQEQQITINPDVGYGIVLIRKLVDNFISSYNNLNNKTITFRKPDRC